MYKSYKKSCTKKNYVKEVKLRNSKRNAVVLIYDKELSLTTKHICTTKTEMSVTNASNSSLIFPKKRP